MNPKMDVKGMDDNCTEVGKLKDNVTNNNEPIIFGPKMCSLKKFHDDRNGQPSKRSREIPRYCQRTGDVIDSIGRRGSTTGTSLSGRSYSSSFSRCCNLFKLPKHKWCRMDNAVDANPMLVEEEEPSDEPESLPIKEAWMPVDRNSVEYNMNHPRRGHAIIFNNEEFDSPSMNREGSNADVESLKDLFTDLGFDITICHNKSRDEIEDIIDKFAKEDHSDADCLVVVVLSHGKGKPYIWARDDFYSVESVWTPFTADKCPTLAGKPKIFIFQACRGNDLDPGVNLSRKHQTETVLSTESHRTPTDAGLPLDLPSVDCFDTAENPSRKRSQSEMNSCSEPYKIPAYADFIFAFCSVEGFASFRNTVLGSWFIQSLCEEFKRNVHTHDLHKLLMNTSRMVALDYESCNPAWEKHKKKQMPVVTSTLIREVYFRPERSRPFKKAYFHPKKWCSVFLNYLYGVADCLNKAFMSFYRGRW